MKVLLGSWVDIDAAEDAGLTVRQVEVFAGYAAGMSREDVCRVLRLSVNTVRMHVRRGFDRLGVESSAAAVARCYDLGIFRPRGVRPGRASYQGAGSHAA